jgi:hypothetical protein
VENGRVDQIARQHSRHEDLRKTFAHGFERIRGV